MPNLKFVHNIVEANGKTIKENNLEKTHSFPISSLVEIDYEGDPRHGIRALVASHDRDFDGSVMYGLTLNSEVADKIKHLKEMQDIALSLKEVEEYNSLISIHEMEIAGGWGEDNLKLIRPPFTG